MYAYLNIKDLVDLLKCIKAILYKMVRKDINRLDTFISSRIGEHEHIYTNYLTNNKCMIRKKVDILYIT